MPELLGIPARATGWDITPGGGNFFQQKAILCNESTAARDFETMRSLIRPGTPAIDLVFW